MRHRLSCKLYLYSSVYKCERSNTKIQLLYMHSSTCVIRLIWQVYKITCISDYKLEKQQENVENKTRGTLSPWSMVCHGTSMIVGSHPHMRRNWREMATQTYLSYPTVNLTMTVPATDALNGTKIQCKTVGTDGIIVESAVAWLWIAGA